MRRDRCLNVDIAERREREARDDLAERALRFGGVSPPALEDVDPERHGRPVVREQGPDGDLQERHAVVVATEGDVPDRRGFVRWGAHVVRTEGGFGRRPSRASAAIALTSVSKSPFRIQRRKFGSRSIRFLSVSPFFLPKLT